MLHRAALNLRRLRFQNPGWTRFVHWLRPRRHDGRRQRRRVLCTRRQMLSKPLLEDNETEQDLVVVALPRTMLIQETAYGRGTQVAVHQRLAVGESVFHCPADGGGEPRIHDVY